MKEKHISEFTDGQHLIIQPKGTFFNAIDSNFLTTNTIAQEVMTRGEVNIFDKGKYRGVLSEFWDEECYLVRYPKSFSNDVESRNWSNHKTVSRDNSIGALIACNLLEMQNYCKLFALDTLWRCSFFQNTHTVKMEKKFLPDFCGFGSWAIILRAAGFKGLLSYPIYLFLDIFLLISTLFFVVKNKYFDNDYNSPLYHMVTAAYFCYLKSPTIFSKANKWVLVNWCPENKAFHEEGMHPIESQLREYSRKDYDPPIYNTTRRLMRRFKDAR